MNIFNLFNKKTECQTLCDLTVLRADSYPCDKCSISDDDHCHKLHFHDRTICVIRKDYADKVTLRSNKRKELPIKH